jgi:hypothetical protein
MKKKNKKKKKTGNTGHSFSHIGRPEFAGSNSEVKLWVPYEPIRYENGKRSLTESILNGKMVYLTD